MLVNLEESDWVWLCELLSQVMTYPDEIFEDDYLHAQRSLEALTE